MERNKDFPAYDDGDVKIVLTGSRQYQLHHNTLTKISPKLARLLTGQNAAKLSSKAIKKGVVVRHRLDAFEVNPDEHSGLKLILRPTGLDDMARNVNGVQTGLDLENGVIVDPVYPAYDVVLGAFYGRGVDLGEFNDSDLSDILQKALPILSVAEYLEVVHLISKSIEASLLATGQIVYTSIVTHPASWLDFAYRIQSRAIFKEALIHAVGQYNTEAIRIAITDCLHPEIVALIEAKAKILLAGVKTAQLKMISYYPLPLQRQSTVGLVDKDHIGRASYSNDIFGWIALTAFRHWISQNVANDRTHHAEDMGFEIMHLISKAGDHYLDKPGMGEFHRFFPMSAKGATVVESKLSEIKEYVRRFVHGLMVENCKLDVKSANCKYFTCTNVEYSEYPWGHANGISRERSADGDGDGDDDDDMEVDWSDGGEVESDASDEGEVESDGFDEGMESP